MKIFEAVSFVELNGFVQVNFQGKSVDEEMMQF